ncbi:unnamed protein product [Chironomus riparius]|uniref:Uncharacterized protein n=1 Tax=Chironomus riparius TaxID=315576 RepID=A0A9N9RMS4_9DIPT|nr:unnamed protein product [Chironomus riparius]
MKIIQTFFTALLAFTLTANASAGSTKEKFEKLFQNSVELSSTIGLFFKETFKPQLGNGYFYISNCITDKIITLMAKGTERLTRIDSNYITEVLNGQNSSPFQNNLNCIKDGLDKMRLEVVNERNLAKQFKNDHVFLNSTRKTCDEYANYTKPYHTFIFEVYNSKTKELGLFNNKFKNLEMLDLYQEFLNTKVNCGLAAVGIVASNIGHVDQQEGIDYFLGTSKNLSFPLNCISDRFDKEISSIKALYAELLMQ